MATGYEVKAFRDLEGIRKAVEEQAEALGIIADALQALIPALQRIASASEAAL